jgi:hypothetical protein
MRRSKRSRASRNRVPSSPVRRYGYLQLTEPWWLLCRALSLGASACRKRDRIDGSGRAPTRAGGRERAHISTWDMPPRCRSRACLRLRAARSDAKAEGRAAAPQWETVIHEGQRINLVFTNPTGGLVPRRAVAKVVKHDDRVHRSRRVVHHLAQGPLHRDLALVLHPSHHRPPPPTSRTDDERVPWSHEAVNDQGSSVRWAITWVRAAAHWLASGRAAPGGEAMGSVCRRLRSWVPDPEPMASSSRKRNRLPRVGWPAELAAKTVGNHGRDRHPHPAPDGRDHAVHRW